MYLVIKQGNGRGGTVVGPAVAAPDLRRAAARGSRPSVARAGLLRGDGVVAQFGRFVLVGGSSNVVYALVFLVLHSTGIFAANVGGVLASTVLANELHRRITFHASARVHWFPAQWEAGGVAIIGLLLSTVSLAVLEAWFPAAGGVVQAVLVVAVSAVVGLLRFLALRGWVFS
ncbi:hypothetical protein GCM10023094_29740 [Rhodococcus olei]|uniref:GtrA/DPMS transmembrane domain-containing protein n=1 Tax=Rhodococcus olei TaxID=2161675 RepID=A0ABP8P3V7_9NOCA